MSRLHPRPTPVVHGLPSPLWLETEIKEYIGMETNVQIESNALRGALDIWRQKHLRKTLQTARAGSFFYRMHWQSIAAALEQWLAAPQRQKDFRGDAALFLRKLPYTLPEHISARAEHFLAVSHNDVAGLVSVPTSGTSGQRKRVFCTQSDLERTVRFFQYGMRHMLDPHRQEHVALLMSGERPGSVGCLLQAALERWGIRCRILGLPTDIDDTARRLAELQPSCIVALPAHMLSLSRHKKSGAIAENLHTVLLSADPASRVLKRIVAEQLHCRVFTHYGLTECGFGGAVECGMHTGCHVREADLWFEIVDSAGDAVPDGVWGEVVMTTLSREAMPLIRYKTGDSGRILPGPCPCGSILQRMEIRGRLSNTIALPRGRILSMEDLDDLCYALQGVQGYRAILCAGPRQPGLREQTFPAKDDANRCVATPAATREKLPPQTVPDRPYLYVTVFLVPEYQPTAVLQNVKTAFNRFPGLYVVDNVQQARQAPKTVLPVIAHCTPHADATGKKFLWRNESE